MSYHKVYSKRIRKYTPNMQLEIRGKIIPSPDDTQINQALDLLIDSSIAMQRSGLGVYVSTTDDAMVLRKDVGETYLKLAISKLDTAVLSTFEVHIGDAIYLSTQSDNSADSIRSMLLSFASSKLPNNENDPFFGGMAVKKRYYAGDFKDHPVKRIFSTFLRSRFNSGADASGISRENPFSIVFWLKMCGLVILAFAIAALIAIIIIHFKN